MTFIQTVWTVSGRNISEGQATAVLHYQWQGLLSGERCARVPPQPVCRCGGTGCKTEGEGSPERGKAQEKRLVSVKVIFPL